MLKNRILLCLLLAQSASLLGADWTMYLHDSAHSSDNTAESRLSAANVGQLQPLWRISVGASLASGVTAVNGRLYFGDWDGNFYAVNAADGSILWQEYLGFAAPPDNPDCNQPAIGVTSQAAVVNGVVYVGGGDSAVYALNADTGQQLWRLPLADPASGSYLWSSVTYAKNSLYVGVASLGDCPLVRGLVARIDPAAPGDPTIGYLAPADQVGAGVWSTPAVDESANTVYVTTGTGDQDESSGLWGGTFLSLDATTLAVNSYFFLPSNSLDGDIEWGSSPTLFQTSSGERLAAANGKDGVMYVVSRDTLQLQWTAKMAVSCVAPEQGCGSISTPAFDGATLFSGAGVRDPDGFPDGSVWAFDPATGAVKWEQDTDGAVIAPLTLAGGMIFASTTSGLVILDAATGKSLWNDGGLGALYSQPVVVDGTIYTTYVNGTVIAWGIPAD